MVATGGGDFQRRLQKEEVQQGLRRESRRPNYTKFSQQELSSCKPVLTPRCTVLLFESVGVMCIAIGVYTLLASRSVVELVNRYDTFCIMKYATQANPMKTTEEKMAFTQDYNKRKNCTITMDVKKLMKLHCVGSLINCYIILELQYSENVYIVKIF